MKRAFVILAILLSLTSTVVFTQRAVDRPGLRLVLLIAVDQFRYDYLPRFRSEYRDGFKKLLEEGAVFTDANLEHYPTVTAIGHSTMLTGATPSVSGIIGNDWFERETGRTVTSVLDPEVTLIGGMGDGASPRRLLVSTLGDQMKLASGRPKGAAEAPKVIGVSLKDRSAIMPVGRGADAAYWFDTRSGAFVTSTFYMPGAPAWVTAFNGRKLADAAAGKPWTALVPTSTVFTTLPAAPGAPLYNAVYNTPYGNDLLLDFATEALTQERLGQRSTVVDLMTVSFSSNDAVGHTFGPDSPQVRDIAVRTDRTIGQLLARVDKLVGLQHVLVALTADHGVAPTPEVLAAQGLGGGRMATRDLFATIEAALAARFGEGKWILATGGTAPYLNDALIAEKRLDPIVVRQVAAAAARAIPHVSRVYTRDQLASGEVPNDRVGQRVLRGFYGPRAGDLEMILEPFWIRAANGATHGTPYNYDAHIPLILMGPQVKRGIYADAVALNDLAPTLASLLDIEPPSGSVGRVLTEAIDRTTVRESSTKPATR